MTPSLLAFKEYLARWRRVWSAALALVLGVAFILVVGKQWKGTPALLRQEAGAFAQERQMQQERDKALAPLLQRAQTLDIKYPQVLAAPWKYLGEPVLWDIKVSEDPSRNSYVDEEIEKPVRWLRQPDIQGGGGHDHRTVTALAKIVDLGPPGCYIPKAGAKQACYVELEFISER